MLKSARASTRLKTNTRSRLYFQLHFADKGAIGGGTGQPSAWDPPRPERVVQLCHPTLGNEFPPLRVTATVASPASSVAHQFRGPRGGTG